MGLAGIRTHDLQRYNRAASHKAIWPAPSGRQWGVWVLKSAGRDKLPGYVIYNVIPTREAPLPYITSQHYFIGIVVESPRRLTG